MAAASGEGGAKRHGEQAAEPHPGPPADRLSGTSGGGGNTLSDRRRNGLFEPIWNRIFIDHVLIDVQETLGLGRRSGLYE